MYPLNPCKNRIFPYKECFSLINHPLFHDFPIKKPSIFWVPPWHHGAPPGPGQGGMKFAGGLGRLTNGFVKTATEMHRCKQSNWGTYI